jgi:hypothetical protein
MGNIIWAIVLLVLAFSNGYFAMWNYENDRLALAWFSLFAALFCAFAAGVRIAGVS